MHTEIVEQVLIDLRTRRSEVQDKLNHLGQQPGCDLVIASLYSNEITECSRAIEALSSLYMNGTRHYA